MSDSGRDFHGDTGHHCGAPFALGQCNCVEMMLPPGANGKQHPAFEHAPPDSMFGETRATTRCNAGYPDHTVYAFCSWPVAASAIANYWDDFYYKCNSDHAAFGIWGVPKSGNTSNDNHEFNRRKAISNIAFFQISLWKRAARGERIENAVIVPLKWE